jgi:hypothetical protein
MLQGRLHHQQPIEGIVMNPGQLLHGENVVGFDRQFQEAFRQQSRPCPGEG